MFFRCDNCWWSWDDISTLLAFVHVSWLWNQRDNVDVVFIKYLLTFFFNVTFELNILIPRKFIWVCIRFTRNSSHKWKIVRNEGIEKNKLKRSTVRRNISSGKWLLSYLLANEFFSISHRKHSSSFIITIPILIRNETSIFPKVSLYLKTLAIIFG